MRAGYARSVAGASFDESVRLEPTQVAGFLQSFRTLSNESVSGSFPSPVFDIAGLSVSGQVGNRFLLWSGGLLSPDGG